MKCFCSEGLLQCHVSLINAYLLIIHCFLIVRFAWIILHMYYVCSLIVLVQWRKLTVDILLLWYVVSVQYGAHENVHGLVDDILTIEQLKPDTVFWIFFTLICLNRLCIFFEVLCLILARSLPLSVLLALREKSVVLMISSILFWVPLFCCGAENSSYLWNLVLNT